MPEGECLYGCHRRKEWEALIRKTNQFIQKTRHTSSKKKMPPTEFRLPALTVTDNDL